LRPAPAVNAELKASRSQIFFRSNCPGGWTPHLLACLLAACFAGHSNPKPAIEFTTVPPADTGGPDKLAPVAGRVRAAHPNQRVVLFARSGAWWVHAAVIGVKRGIIDS
jgi:hypothetical protein